MCHLSADFAGSIGSLLFLRVFLETASLSAQIFSLFGQKLRRFTDDQMTGMPCSSTLEVSTCLDQAGHPDSGSRSHHHF